VEKFLASLGEYCKSLNRLHKIDKVLTDFKRCLNPPESFFKVGMRRWNCWCSMAN